MSRLIKPENAWIYLKMQFTKSVEQKKYKGNRSTDALNWLEKKPNTAIPDKLNRILQNVSNRIKVALENSMRTMSLYLCNRPKHQGSLSTGCSPSGFSIPGSVLHMGLAEPRAALPGRGLARACAGGRLEGWAEVTEHKHVIRHTECHQMCYRHLLIQNMQNTHASSVLSTHSFCAHSQREHACKFCILHTKDMELNFAPFITLSICCMFLGVLGAAEKKQNTWHLKSSLAAQAALHHHLIRKLSLKLSSTDFKLFHSGEFYSTPRENYWRRDFDRTSSHLYKHTGQDHRIQMPLYSYAGSCI